MLRFIVANSPDMMFCQDRDQRYTWAMNPVPPLTAERLLGKTDFDLLSVEEARVLSEAKSWVLETGITHRFEAHVTLLGHEHFFDMIIQPCRDRDGRVVGIAGYARDITEHKRLEERLLSAHRLEAARQLAAQVGREFNTLLAPTATYPELIKMELPAGHRASRYCDAMAASVQRMVDIGADMTFLGTSGGSEQRPTDLNGLVADVVLLVADRPETLSIQLDLASDLLPVYGSRLQLLRLVSNLLSNAREATGDAGSISIKTENVYIDQPIDRYDRIETGEYARLSVADSGPGVAPEIRDSIFDPFFTTRRSAKGGNRGLGLTIVLSIVRDHHGFLDLESEAGKGTMFSVYLPVSRGPSEQRAPGDLRGGSETILVVDHDRSQLQVADLLLSRLGYRVETARSGREAVEYLREHSADLLILNMVTPGEIGGAEAYRRILEIRPGQRAIIMSGSPESNRAQPARALGPARYLRKPLTLERLGRAVREELDRLDRAKGNAGRCLEGTCAAMRK